MEQGRLNWIAKSWKSNLLSKSKRDTKLGSRIAEVHNGSSLFTGELGEGLEEAEA